MYFFFYIFDGWSIVKLTGSMFFLSIFSSFFRLMVGLQVDGSLGVVLGGSKSLCGWSWAAPRASVGGPWPLSGRLWVVLGRSQGLCVVLGRSQGLCGRSWAAIRPEGGPGSSGKAIWAGIWAQMFPWPEREGDLEGRPRTPRTLRTARTAQTLRTA